jgi:hypothetical protein
LFWGQLVKMPFSSSKLNLNQIIKSEILFIKVKRSFQLYRAATSLPAQRLKPAWSAPHPARTPRARATRLHLGPAQAACLLLSLTHVQRWRPRPHAGDAPRMTAVAPAARALSLPTSSLSPASLRARALALHRSRKPSGSSRHRHFAIASASSSASAFANPCARIGPRSHHGEARVAVFLRGGAMAAWLDSPRLAPPHPSSVPFGLLFVLAIIPRSSRAPRWALRWLAPAGRCAPAPPCHHAHR